MKRKIIGKHIANKIIEVETLKLEIIEIEIIYKSIHNKQKPLITNQQTHH